MEESDKKNAIVVDTNVLIHDPKAIDVLREGGNTLFVPWMVILELDHLKNRPDIGLDAAEAIARIDELHGNKNKTLVIAREKNFGGLKGL
jgi:predicted ribonuclease YlaK